MPGPLDEVFSFLAKVLGQNREEAFHPESPVGAALTELLQFLQLKAADLTLFQELAGRKGYFALCSKLAPSAVRKLHIELLAWVRRDHLLDASFYSLFSCFFQCDLMKMMDDPDQNVQEQFQGIYDDLASVVDSLLGLRLDESDAEHLLGNIHSSHLVCLFLFPRLLDVFPESFGLHRKLLATVLSCTATAMPPSLVHEAEHFDWLLAEFPKTLAIRLNLQCAQKCNDQSKAYEFYSEVTFLLEGKLSCYSTGTFIN